MAEKIVLDDFSSEKLATSEVGSPESRAAARALLEQKDYRGPPRYVALAFVGGIGYPEGRKSPNYEFDRAEIYEHTPVSRSSRSPAAPMSR
jgi:transposase InsO family protein